VVDRGILGKLEVALGQKKSAQACCSQILINFPQLLVNVRICAPQQVYIVVVRVQ
jgi:hypothetical protein